jgi:hypothetical protein
MRIEPPPSPLVPPELASQTPTGDALAATPFASLLGDAAPPEPSERALTFVELGMFGAYAGVSPARLSLGLEDQAQGSEPTPEPPPAAPTRSASVAAASAPDDPQVAAEMEIHQPAQQCSACVVTQTPACLVTETSAATRTSVGAPPSVGFSEPSAVVDEAAPMAVSVPRSASTPTPTPAPAPPEVRLRTVAQASFEDVGLGAAPEKRRAPKQATGRAPLAAVLVEEGGTAKLAVAAAALAPGGGARLRALAARLLAEHGLELDEMWINGGSEPASAAQGEGHGSRTN